MKRISLASVSLLLSLLAISPSSAHWSIDERVVAAKKSFIISRDEAIDLLEDKKLYALVEYGVISKIFLWDESKKNYIFNNYIPGSALSLDLVQQVVFVAHIPNSLAVNYSGSAGEVESEPINQGDTVTVVESLPENSLQNLPGQYVNPVDIIGTAVAPNYSTSITIAPITIPDLNKTVEVQVITNGISFTSFTTDNTSTPVTISNLPSNSFVSVQTVIRDQNTNEETILQNLATKTPDAQIPVIENSRDVTGDLQSIQPPIVAASVVHENGGRSASIEYAGIPNFNPETTLASIMVVGPGGATTSIGIDGTGGTLNIGDLALDSTYRLTLVIRDINSGEETIIRGANL